MLSRTCGKSYATIDIRVTVARMKKGEEWQYIFCKVRLTKESSSHIQRIHNEKKKRLICNEYFQDISTLFEPLLDSSSSLKKAYKSLAIFVANRNFEFC